MTRVRKVIRTGTRGEGNIFLGHYLATKTRNASGGRGARVQVGESFSNRSVSNRIVRRQVARRCWRLRLYFIAPLVACKFNLLEVTQMQYTQRGALCIAPLNNAFTCSRKRAGTILSREHPATYSSVLAILRAL